MKSTHVYAVDNGELNIKIKKEKKVSDTRDERG